ncbi:hypothetical protein BaRGS_00019384 [Batillaria attramentaria]|uniref:Secreted protein n=1 Tax=Batillaria attramentaria TaxID=370345 RepID=A0ABD0KQP9_9CAEN
MDCLIAVLAVQCSTVLFSTLYLCHFPPVCVRLSLSDMSFMGEVGGEDRKMTSQSLPTSSRGLDWTWRDRSGKLDSSAVGRNYEALDSLTLS